MTGKDMEKYRRKGDFPVFFQEEVPSTNDLAKRAAAEGLREGGFVALRQTSGRGRMGRTFVSPDGGLYLSYLLTLPIAQGAEGLCLTTAASVAVCKAVEDVCSVKPWIKWVNDLVVNGKKVCGILTEAVTRPETGEMAVIIGVGLNVYTKETEFPKTLQGIAGSMVRDPAPHLLPPLAAAVLDGLWGVQAACLDGSWLPLYRERSLVLGRPVRFARDGVMQSGVAESIDDRGGLTVRLPDGTLTTLSTGEITLRVTEE